MKRLSGCGTTTLPLIVALVTALLTGPAIAATITVDFTGDVDTDDGQCALREAIINANNNDQSGSTDCAAGATDGSRDTIEFDPSTDGTAISIGIGGDEDLGVAGDFDVTDDLEIIGNGPGRTILDGGSLGHRVFEAHAFLGLSEMTVRGGEAATGAGVQALGATLVLQNVVVRDNLAAAGAGITAISADIYVQESVIRDNRVDGDIGGTRTTGMGGGILTLDNAGVGSGTSDALVIEDSRIVGNLVENPGNAYGGGLMLSPSLTTLRIEGSEISGNRVRATGGEAHGGGLFLRDDDVYEITNATISGNEASSDILAQGGGLSVANTTSGGVVIGTSGDVNNTTITANVATGLTGGIGFGGGIETQSSLKLMTQNTLLAGNSATQGAPDCSGALRSEGYTLVGSNAGCSITLNGSGNIIGDVAGGGLPVDPMLTTLADWGGPTHTHMLIEGSPAVDAGNPNPVLDGMPPACEPEDQRDTARPRDGDNNGGAVCDIGAVEGVFNYGSGGGGGGAGGPMLLLLVALAAWRHRTHKQGRRQARI